MTDNIEKKVLMAIADLSAALKEYDAGNNMPNLKDEINALNNLLSEFSITNTSSAVSSKVDKLHFEIKNLIIKIMGDIDNILHEYTKNDQGNNLDGLNERVLTICELLRALPVATAKKLVPQIETMYASVNKIAQSINEKKQSVEEELNALQNTSKANKSYKNFKND